MSNGPSAPTLDDVARAAGVSTATVSRCLNTPERVVERTRSRVLEAVERLGYTPNFGARVMAAKRTMTIGAIVPTLENAIFARGLQAFQEEVTRAGYTLLMASSAYQPDLEAEQIKSLVARGADGLLLIGHDRDPKIYDYLRTQGVASVIAWTYDENAPQVAVGFDNRAGMFGLADRVLALGHRRIAVISGVQLGNDRVRQRIDGVRAAAQAHGLEPDAVDVIESVYDISAGGDALAALMGAPMPPTAVLCVNDVLAVGALKRAQAMGLNVPGDVSITGFDDSELAILVEPPLTTVRVPHRAMGLAAARELVGMVENKGNGTSHRLETSIKLRASLGPPKGRAT